MKWLLVLTVLFSMSFGKSMAANDAIHERQIADLKDEIVELQNSYNSLLEVVKNMIAVDKAFGDSHKVFVNALKDIYHQLGTGELLMVCMITLVKGSPDMLVDDMIDACHAEVKKLTPSPKEGE
ncbi:MAG: hypothetical protein OXC40_03800 [Proteobacteria bacterium]|nr:hypothetical protein [Pseudomonadota bacterium]